MAISGILCFNVQEYTKELAVNPKGNAANFAEEDRIPDIPPSDIGESMKDITGKLTCNPGLVFQPASVPAAGKNNTDNIIPPADYDNAEHTVPAADRADIGTVVLTAGNDDTETALPVVSIEESRENDSDIHKNEAEFIDPPVSIEEVEIREPVMEETDAGSPAISESETTAGGNEANTEDSDTQTSEIMGFMIDEKGYITGITDSIDTTDGVLVVTWNQECTGIRNGALSGLAGFLDEIYIPANILDIEPGTFDAFSSLLYIEVAEDNPCYYSENGVLYSK